MVLIYALAGTAAAPLCWYDEPRLCWFLCAFGSRPGRQSGAFHCSGQVSSLLKNLEAAPRCLCACARHGADRSCCSTGSHPGGHHPSACNSPFLDIIDAKSNLGMYPGPTIEVNQGDRLIVKVQNNLPNATSIHWHGLVRGTTSFESLSILTNGSSFKMAQIGTTARQELQSVVSLQASF